MPGGLGLEPRGPVQTRRVQGLGLGLGLGPLVCFRWRPDRMPPIMKNQTCLEQVGARFGLGLARGLLCLLRLSLAGGLGALNQVDVSKLDK